MKNKYYIGLDVHKETIAIAHARGANRENAVYHGQCGGSVPAAEKALRKLAEKLGVEFRDLKVCYEAGPTGFVLARRLIRLGLDCVLMSPSKTERKPNEKIKTDKRDACKIAKLFRNGDITVVRIPPALDEAVRDVCRARTDATDDLSRAKQRLSAFLLRNGFNYTGRSKWSAAHMRYLRELVMPHDAHKIVLEEYMQAIDTGIERVARLVDKMKQLLSGWEWEPVVRALMACKGFQEVAAMTIISELGDSTPLHPSTRPHGVPRARSGGGIQRLETQARIHHQVRQQPLPLDACGMRPAFQESAQGRERTDHPPDWSGESSQRTFMEDAEPPSQTLCETQGTRHQREQNHRRNR